MSSSSVGWRRSIVERSLRRLDRWGDGPKRQTTVVGGILGCFMLAGVCLFGALSAEGYLNRPMEIATETKWSASFGPYPMEFTCYYDTCWLSVEYSTQLEIKGQSYKCAKLLEADQAHRCHELKHGEVISIGSCYSHLPQDGLRLHFFGKPHWSNAFGLDETDGLSYGLTIASDMNGEDGPTPMPTPIRAGLHVTTYVRTKNTTLPDNTPGSLRNEWFLQEITTDIPARYLTGDGCASVLSSKNAELLVVKDVNGSTRKLCSGTTSCSTTALRVRTAVLTMAPWFTEASVRRESLWTCYLQYTGELGGIAAMFDILLLGITLAYYHFLHKRSVKFRLTFCDAPGGDDHQTIAMDLQEVRELKAQQIFQATAAKEESSSWSSAADAENRLSQVEQQVADLQAMLKQQSLQLEELQAQQADAAQEIDNGAKTRLFSSR
eukprot:TRINITY_DN12209_c0_g1_i1.p1 TRINITY_DN12209_c0_g1~~TRINITY_DN12209_c0_g1_i1.p1  ORF type:complete len:436 (+),score=52.02 TRINITY_DN12209_c0_g1_i1:89-1396(+)